MKARFELKGVSKYYDDSGVIALDGVNLTLFDRKINALVGKSGCGKSTLARVILRLEPYEKGEIVYHSKKIESVPVPGFRKKNQVVFQNPFLSVNPCFTVREILSDPMEVEKKTKTEIKEKIDFLLDLVGLSPGCLMKYPQELSGGELQRITLARALTLDPEFLVLDEPFSALDEIMAGRMIRYFKKIAVDLGIGMLFISHHLKHVESMADVIDTMESGRIISQCFQPGGSFREAHCMGPLL